MSLLRSSPDFLFDPSIDIASLTGLIESLPFGVGCGRRSRTFIFGFKARRVASYTIPRRTALPQKSCLAFLPQEAQNCPQKLVAVEGIEPTSLDYQSSALAVELHREIG